MDQGWRKVAAVMLVCILISQAHFFRELYWRYILYDNVGDPVVLTALAAREATKSNESLLFFGENFSSVVPFYGERKSLGVVPWVSPALFDKIISDPQSLLGGAPLGGIIDCRQTYSAEQMATMVDAFPISLYTYSAEQLAKIDAFLFNRRIVFHNGHCRLIAP
jgi:hypothetical protein